MRTFAEQEVVIPDGPHKGKRWRAHRQPYCGLFLDAMDSGRWPKAVVLGDVQGGKTFAANVIPSLYHLFERGQTVVYGVPDLDSMGRSKWEEDLLPAIEASKYRELLPRSGGGSRGGYAHDLKFANGATLKFMGYQGGDHRRSGFTAPVAVLTEIDKGDVAKEASRETDPITQILRRLRSYARTKEWRAYLECTVSIPTGRIWQEYCGDRIEDPDVETDGVYSTESRLSLPCPHCKDFVTLDRDDLCGWQDARTKVEARLNAAFYCSRCGEKWTETEWVQANLHAVLVHRGQEIAGGRISGEPVATDTLGFRWTTANNLFVTPGDVGQAEWEAERRARAGDRAGLKDCLQFWWVTPWREDEGELSPLAIEEIRAGQLSRGELPADTEQFAVAADCGMFEVHWVAIAGRAGCRYVVDYGSLATGIKRGAATADERREAATVALRETLLGETLSGTPTKRPSLAGLIAAGWGTGGTRLRPGLVLVDAGYLSDVVHSAVRRGNQAKSSTWMAFVGRGTGQFEDGRLCAAYTQPIKKTQTIRYLGERYFAQKHQKHQHQYAIVDADYWKTVLHDAFRITPGGRGSISLFRDTSGREHQTYRRHLTAEQLLPDPNSRHGALRWQQIRKANHYGDATYAALVALHRLGLRVEMVEDSKEAAEADTQWWSRTRKVV